MAAPGFIVQTIIFGQLQLVIDITKSVAVAADAARYIPGHSCPQPGQTTNNIFNHYYYYYYYYCRRPDDGGAPELISFGIRWRSSTS